MDKTVTFQIAAQARTAAGTLLVPRSGVWIEPEDCTILTDTDDTLTVAVQLSQTDADKIQHLQHTTHRHVLDGCEPVEAEDYDTIQLVWMSLYDSLDRITCDD